MPRTDDPLVDALQERVDDGLRVVGHHDADSWTIEFMREDVTGTYENDSLDEIAADLALSEVGSAHQEDLYELGSLHATMRLFEHGLLVHVPVGETSGYVISLDDDTDVVGRDVVELVRDTVD